MAVADIPLVATPPTFAEVLEALYRERYTGSVTIHLQSGRPIVVEKPRPLQIPLKRT